MQILMVIVRFAPSPTGIPHVGNIRTAIFNYFFAKKEKGKFILRIEDTDQARKVEGAEDIIKESLTWLGCLWDEYIVQSENVETYKKYANELLEKGLAKKDGDAIRFITPKEGKTSWIDKVGNKKIEFENSEIEDFIILKTDGFPTYHLANIIDDHAEGVTHVIRGEDWIPSAPKHIMLYNAFGWNVPEFAHVPNILGTDNKKLSKRRGAKSVLDFRKEGYLPEALLNYLMLLGWSPKDDREILEKQEIENIFALENVNVAPSVFDERKLEWMNGEYIRKMSNEELKKKIQAFSEVDEIDDKFLELAKSRMKTLLDFKTLVMPLINGEKIELSNEEKEISKKLLEKLSGVDNWNKDSILAVLKEVISDGIKMKTIYKIFIGSENGLPLPESLEIIGKEKTLELLS